MSARTAICYGGPWHGSRITTPAKYTELQTHDRIRYLLWRFVLDERRVVMAWVCENENPESEDVLAFVKAKMCTQETLDTKGNIH